MRVRREARKSSASVITAVALAASHPLPIVSAVSRAAESASSWSWFFCHSTEPASRTRAAEPISATSESATSTMTWPD